MDVCQKCRRQIKTRKMKSPKDSLCRTCFNVQRAETYFEQMEKNRLRDEKLNQRSYDQLRELSAWVSIYRYGAAQYREQAERMINCTVETSFPPYD